MCKENNQQQVWTLRPKLKQGRRFHNDSKNDAIVYLRRMQIKGTIGKAQLERENGIEKASIFLLTNIFWCLETTLHEIV